MKVYLAGKMDDLNGTWRDTIIGPGKLWIISRPGDILETSETVRPWPTEKNSWVFGIHDYVGPYRQDFEHGAAKHEGYFHGSTITGQHGQPDFSTPGDHQIIVSSCMEAIVRCDMLFAYINSPDCYGTMAEIGIARALGKYVYVVITDGAHTFGEQWGLDSHGEPFTVGDFWFIEELAHHSPSAWEIQKKAQDSEPLQVHNYFQDALNKAHTYLAPQTVDRALARAEVHPRLLVQRHWRNPSER